MELKLQPPIHLPPVKVPFKLDHYGIEIDLDCLSIMLFLFFKLDHYGIEITLNREGLYLDNL